MPQHRVGVACVVEELHEGRDAGGLPHLSQRDGGEVPHAECVVLELLLEGVGDVCVLEIAQDARRVGAELFVLLVKERGEVAHSTGRVLPFELTDAPERVESIHALARLTEDLHEAPHPFSPEIDESELGLLADPAITVSEELHQLEGAAAFHALGEELEHLLAQGLALAGSGVDTVDAAFA